MEGKVVDNPKEYISNELNIVSWHKDDTETCYQDSSLTMVTAASGSNTIGCMTSPSRRMERTDMVSV